MIDLQDCSPQDLVDGATLPELWAAARAVGEWDSPTAEALDYIHRHRLLELLRRGHDARVTNELEEFGSHLRRVVPAAARDALDGLRRPYAKLWAAYAHLVDSRLSSLRLCDPEKILSRKHVRKILDLLADGLVQYQCDLAKAFDFGKANLSRILKDMEKVELIERTAEGHSNRIRLGPRAPEEYAERKSKTHDRANCGFKGVFSPSPSDWPLV